MQKEIRKTISKIKETGLQLLFPGRCPVCDGIVRPFGRKICPECLPKLKPVTAPWCMRCGKKLAEEREYCGDCMHREHKYDRARTLYEYRDVAPSIYRFKYSGRQEYGDFFGEEMARLLGDFIGRVRPDVIVPVPLYRGKLRKRGYNQAACLARALGRSLELPVDEKLVKRVRNTAPMKHLNPTERQNNLKKAKEIAMRIVFLLCAFLSVVAVIFVCKFVFQNGIPAIKEIGFKNFILGETWKPKQEIFGIFPMILGSIYVTAGAIIIGVPIGVFTAVFLAFYCPKRLYSIMKPVVNLLAGIPSIVYGFFCLVAVVPVIQKITHTSGKGILTASILLGIMILPTVINTCESSLRSVAPSYYEGSLALGATKEYSIFKAVFPVAKSGIVSGIILGIGRAIGETMAVVMIAGNQAIIPKSITSGVRTLTGNIVLEMAYASGLHRRALIATAAVLFVFVLIINLCFSLAVHKREGKR